MGADVGKLEASAEWCWNQADSMGLYGLATRTMEKDRTPKVRLMPQRSDVRLAEQIAREVVHDLNPRSVLDVGCGDGIVQRFLSRNCLYRGLDITEACIYEKCDNNGDIYYVDPSEIEKQIKADAPWDAVLLLDVIEHTPGFTNLFEAALESAGQWVLVSLPNELFFVERIKMLKGIELNAHSLDLEKMPEGFRHQYIININKAREILKAAAKTHGFSLIEEIQRPLIAKNRWLQPGLAALRKLASSQVWSMGSVFVFEKEK